MGDVKFLADYHLQKLGRWLRFLGQDVEILEKKLIPSDIISKMRDAKYIFLTRDTFWNERNEIKPVFIKSDHLEEQLKQLAEQNLIEIDSKNLFKKCSNCNCKVERVDKEKVKEKIPPRTYLWLDEYWQCPSCNQLYWNGTHIEKIKQIISRINVKPEDRCQR